MPHRPMNQSIAENFMRSANAPVISAGVMIAKVIWNVMNTVSGIVAGSASSTRHAGEEQPSRSRR